MNRLELINQGSKKLRNQNIKSFRLDSEILLSKILDKKRENILINLDEEVKYDNILKFNKLINRRCSKEPIAYILNTKEFWSKPFRVSTDTLIPRPETELLVESLVDIYKNKKISILDIGVGSGCILISLLSDLSKSKGVGIDISRKALLIAKNNAKFHNVLSNIKFFRKSFLDIFNYKFDLIVSNPPYIESKYIKNLDEDIKRFEPLIALDGGNDGLDVIRKVIYKSKKILKINGKLALEIGNKQYLKVSKILLDNNFRVEVKIQDFKKNIRCLISRLIK